MSREEPSVYFIDMDGTLVDTDYANFLAYQHALREATNGRFDIASEAGRRFDRVALKAALPRLDDAELARVVRLKARYYPRFLPETKVNAALLERLRTIRATRMNTLVLVTDSEEKRAVQTLRHHDLELLFSSLYCRAAPDKSRNKYRRTLAQLRVPCQSVFVFESDASAIDKAMLAGIPRERIVTVGMGANEVGGCTCESL